MQRRLKIALVAPTAVLVAATASAVFATQWVKQHIQEPEYCGSCHVMAPYNESWKSSALTAHTHAQLGLTCQECHVRSVQDGLREIVSNATHGFEVPLKDNHPRAETCLRCHGSYEILAARTQNLIGPDGFALGRNPHDSHWGELDCGICHKMHKPSVDFCSRCHGLPVTGPAWESAALP